MEKSLKSLLKEVTKEDFQSIFYATVKEISTNGIYLTVLSNEDLNEVRGVISTSTYGDGGVDYLPTIGSSCIVFRFGRNYLATSFSKLESIDLLSSDNGGLIIIQKLVDRINELESALTSIQSTLNTHTHTVQVDPNSGVGNTVVQSNQNTAIIPNTSVDDLENPNVRH